MNTNVKTATEKRSVSGAGALFNKADERMRELSITNFSEYVRRLILNDLQREKAEAAKANQPTAQEAA